MSYLPQLEFLQKILNEMSISSCIVTNPDISIPTTIDLGLRSSLFGLLNYVHFFDNSMNDARDNTIYRFYDEYDCNYIFLRLPEKGYFFIGPYLLSILPQERIVQKSEQLKLTPEQFKLMNLYFSGLPIIENENLLLTMINAFAKELWQLDNYTLDYIDYVIIDRHKPIPVSKSDNMGNSTLDLSTLEGNYSNENLLMDAVSKGKLHLVTAVASSVFNNGTEPLLTDSLRERKNNLIILKTLLRKAAEYGGVHPLHIHRLSNQFTEQIETICTLKQSLRLQDEMIRSYCLLVKKHSLNRYSYYVGQAITLVQYDLTTDLRLKTIAQKLNVNASYLSALFHKEYGCTLTEYVTRQRIDYGIYLLQTTKKSVQEIATECGIQETTYFIKLFKKQTGYTPNQYKTNIKTY